MSVFYSVVFALLLGVLGAIKFKYRSKGSDEVTSPEFQEMQRNYLVGFLLFKMADWLQGPYFYEVYKEKIFDGEPISEDMIARLFLFGFGSSMIFGTFIGGVVDKLGRKKGCLLFVALYILSALSTHSTSYPILCFGRILGGIATSLLFSAPESWLVSQHHASHFNEGWLGSLFGWMYFGDGIVAIIAGLVASFAASVAGPVGPFNVSVVFLVLGGLWVNLKWTENFGDTSSSSDGGANTNFGEALSVILKDPRILRLGLIQSLFEGSMYTFVLLWVPALKHGSYALDWGIPPFGFIFASFMVACMIGSSIFAVGLSASVPVEKLALYLLAAAFASILIAVAFSTNLFVLLPCFLLFEACVGVYFPSMGTMRSSAIPEEVRSTVMNIYRVPLNLLVVTVFLNIGALGTQGALSVAALALGIATYIQYTNERGEKRGGASMAVPVTDPSFHSDVK